MPVRSSTPEQRKKRLQGLRRYFWLATLISVIWVAVALWALFANAAATKTVAYILGRCGYLGRCRVARLHRGP